MKANEDRLSYWFGKVDIIMPSRSPVTMSVIREEIPEAFEAFVPMNGSETIAGVVGGLSDRILELGFVVGFPFFLRNDVASFSRQNHGDPDWINTPLPYILSPNRAKIAAVIYQMALLNKKRFGTFDGCDRWHVRKMMSLDQFVHGFNGLPIAPEVRVITKDGGRAVSSSHSRWGRLKIERPTIAGKPCSTKEIDVWVAALERTHQSCSDHLHQMTRELTERMNGQDWAVDWTLTTTGVWRITNMTTV